MEVDPEITVITILLCKDLFFFLCVGVNNALSGGPLALPPLHSENMVAPNLTQSCKRAKGLIFKKNRRLICGPSLRDGITSNDLWITLGYFGTAEVDRSEMRSSTLGHLKENSSRLVL